MLLSVIDFLSADMTQRRHPQADLQNAEGLCHATELLYEKWNRHKSLNQQIDQLTPLAALEAPQIVEINRRVEAEQQRYRTGQPLPPTENNPAPPTQDAECPICFSEIDPPGSAGVSTTSCDHSFCTQCLRQWFGAYDEKPCPMCRRTIYRRDFQEL